MIPEYPRYTDISKNLQPEVRRFASQYPPYSDFSFVNLIGWNNDGHGRLSFLNGNLVMHYPDYVVGDHFISFLGNHAVEPTVETLLDEAQRTTHERKLYLVPEIGATALAASKRFEVKEDPDSHDYVISLTKLATMEGKDLYHFRRAVRSFSKQYPEAVFRQLDLADASDVKNVSKVFVEREANKDYNDSDYELEAMQKTLADATDYPLAAYGIEIDKAMRAFIICELVDQNWSIGHFWKADINYEGIYSYLMHRTSEALAQQGVSRMNIQQDLGLEGLRKFKNYMRPVANLKKYTVTDA